MNQIKSWKSGGLFDFQVNIYWSQKTQNDNFSKKQGFSWWVTLVSCSKMICLAVLDPLVMVAKKLFTVSKFLTPRESWNDWRIGRGWYTCWYPSMVALTFKKEEGNETTELSRPLKNDDAENLGFVPLWQFDPEPPTLRQSVGNCRDDATQSVPDPSSLKTYGTH